MKTIKYFMIFMGLTLVFWYLAVSFVFWDITWASEMPNYQNTQRLWTFAAFLFKILLDSLIYFGAIETTLKKRGKL